MDLFSVATTAPEVFARIAAGTEVMAESKWFETR
jgi:hypothetical protein